MSTGLQSSPPQPELQDHHDGALPLNPPTGNRRMRTMPVASGPTGVVRLWATLAVELGERNHGFRALNWGSCGHRLTRRLRPVRFSQSMPRWCVAAWVPSAHSDSGVIEGSALTTMHPSRPAAFRVPRTSGDARAFGRWSRPSSRSICAGQAPTAPHDGVPSRAPRGTQPEGCRGWWSQPTRIPFHIRSRR